MAVALASSLLAAAPAAAQAPAAQADKLNDEGKRLFAAKDYEAAHAKFREARTLSPEGRFFFNECYALNFLERYEEAIEACEQVEAAGADAALVQKTRKALASLREKASSARARPAAAVGTADQPGEPRDQVPPERDVRGPGGPPPPPPGGPDPFVSGQAPPPSSYKWAVGGTFGVVGNLNVGREVDNTDGLDQEVYGPGGADMRLFANFIVSEPARLGVQASLAFGAIAPGVDNRTDDNLVLADVGGALFLHLPLGRRVFITPLVGPQLSVQQPEQLSQGYIAFGARTELGLSFVFGRSSEHAISVTPALNVYFPATGEVEDLDPGEFGLDETRSTFGVAAGYTYRFSTPFGAVPLITLE